MPYGDPSGMNNPTVFFFFSFFFLLPGCCLGPTIPRVVLPCRTTFPMLSHFSSESHIFREGCTLFYYVPSCGRLCQITLVDSRPVPARSQWQYGFRSTKHFYLSPSPQKEEEEEKKSNLRLPKVQKKKCPISLWRVRCRIRRHHPVASPSPGRLRRPVHCHALRRLCLVPLHGRTWIDRLRRGAYRVRRLSLELARCPVRGSVVPRLPPGRLHWLR